MEHATSIHPEPSAQNTEGDFDHFRGFMRELVSIPHETIKARIAEEKSKPKPSSRVPAAS